MFELLSYIVIKTILFRIGRCRKNPALDNLKTYAHKHTTMHSCLVRDSIIFSTLSLRHRTLVDSGTIY